MKVSAYVKFFTVALIVIALDIWTKNLVRQLPLYSTWLPNGWEWLAPYARVLHSYNMGAAFGSFQNLSLLFTILAFVVAGFLIYYMPVIAGSNTWMQVAMGLQLGGALGNVIDRLFHNMAVTDFISIGSFAIFNVADSGITVGTTILVLCMLIQDQKDKKIEKEKEETAANVEQ